MPGIISGVNIMCRFITPSSNIFSSYVNYIDREEATRNSNIDKFNAYMDYMGNPEKTSEIFTLQNDQLSENDLKTLKSDFEKAQSNKSLMWQTVISFDNRWLEENGLFDERTGAVDTIKIKELSRGCISKMLEKENMEKSAEWSAAIHYNTDNIHIHIAVVEPHPMRKQMITKDGKQERRGKWKYSSIKAGRSNMVNKILSQQKENQMINDLIRTKIIGHKKEQSIRSNDEFKELFQEVYDGLPADRRKWNYNSLDKDTKEKIDLLSKRFINQYHAEDYAELESLIKTQEKKYSKAYGAGEKVFNNYSQNKEKDLFTRLGNTIMKEMKEYDYDIRKKTYESDANIRRIENYKKYRRMQSLASIQREIERDLSKTKENYMNMSTYEKIIREQDGARDY